MKLFVLLASLLLGAISSLHAEGSVSARITGTGRLALPAKAEDLRLTLFVDISQNRMRANLSESDIRSYREKYDLLKRIEVTAKATVKSQVYVNGVLVGSVEPEKPFTGSVVLVGRADYEVKLLDMSGAVLDLETGRRKTGL